MLAQRSAVQRTCYDLGALEVLIRVQVARRQRKVDAREDQQEVDSAPHCDCKVGAPLEGCEEQLMRISVVVEVGETLKSQRCARL